MLVLLVGAVGIYSMASSTAEVTKAQPSNQASEAQFYEVSEDTADSTAPPGVTVVGQRACRCPILLRSRRIQQ